MHAKIRSHWTDIPRGLDVSVEGFDGHQELLESIEVEDSDSDAEEKPRHMTTPAIGAVHRPADVELATRFLFDFMLITGRQPTGAMLGFASKLYVKGLLTFKESGLLHLHFSHYVCHSLQADRLALRWLNMAELTDCSFATRFQFWRLKQQLRVDTTFTKRFAKAKKCHFKALEGMRDFWRLLQTERVESCAPHLCARSIVDLTQDALDEYQKALRFDDGDRPFTRLDVPLTVNYGLFIEQVLMDAESADSCFQVSGDFCMQQRSKAMAGAKRKRATGAEVSISQLPSRFDLRRAVGEGGESQKQMDSMTGIRAIEQARMVVNAVFMFLAVLLCLYLILAALTVSNRRHIVRAADAVGRSRSYAMQGAVLVDELSTTNPLYPPPNPILSEADRDTLRGYPYSLEMKRQKLLGVTRDLHTSFNEMTWGSSTSTFGMLRRMLTLDYFVEVVPLNDTAPADFTSPQEPTNLWTLLFKVLEVFYMVQNKDLKDHSMGADFKSVGTVLGPVSDGLNRTALVYEDWNAELTSLMGTVLVVIYVVCLILIAMVFALLVIRFRSVSHTRNSVRHATVLTPSAVMRKMEAGAQSRIDDFSKYKEAPEGYLKAMRYLGDQDPHGGGPLDLSPHGAKASKPEEEDDHNALEEAEAERQRRDQALRLQHSSSAFAKLSTAFRVSYLLAAMLAVALLTCSILILVSGVEQEDNVHQIIRTLADVDEAMVGTMWMEQNAGVFVIYPAHWKYERFWDTRNMFLTDTGPRRRLLDATAPCCAAGQAMLVRECFIISKILVDDYQAAMAFTVEKYAANTPGLDVSGLYRSVANYVPVLPSDTTAVREFGHPLSLTKWYKGNTTTHVTTEEADRLSRWFVFGREHRLRFESVNELWMRLHTVLGESFRSEASSSANESKTYRRVSWILAVLCVAASAVAVTRVQREQLRFTPLLNSCFFVIIGMAIVAAALSLHDEIQHDSVIDQLEGDGLECDRWGRYLQNAQWMHSGAARAFVVTGDVSFLLEVQDNDKAAIDVWRNRFEGMAAQEMEPADEAKVKQDFEDLWEVRNTLAHLEGISTRMGIKAYGIDPRMVPKGADYEWDVKEDMKKLNLKTRTHFEMDPYQFTNTTYDLLLPEDRMLTVAQRTILAPWFSDLYEDFTVRTNKISRDVCGTLHTKLKAKLSSSKELRSVSMVCAACASGAVFLIFGALLVSLLLGTKGSDTAPDAANRGTGGKATMKSTSEQEQVRYMALALSLVGILVTITFSTTYVGLASSSGIAVLIHESTARPWLVARSMLEANRLTYDGNEYVTTIYKLSESVRQMEDAEAGLFFGDSEDSGKYVGVGKDAKQDALLFTSGASVGSLYGSCNNASLDTYTNSKVDIGVSVLYAKWLDAIRELVATDPADTRRVAQIVLMLRDLYWPLIDGLHESMGLYVDNVLIMVEGGFRVVLVVVVVSMILMVGVFLRVFRPLVSQLEEEEGGTRLMLRMIPQEVRELPEVMEALGAMPKQQAVTVQLHDAITELSTAAMVATDQSGIVIKATNTSLKNIFGYSASEIAGSQVTKLMPERYASNHPQFMTNYRRVGKSSIFGKTRRFEGRRKDGTEFPCEVHVREHVCESGDVLLIGALTDVSDASKLRTTVAINQALFETAQVPIIIIDQYGKMIQSNRQSHVDFGTTDLVGHNVKKLMPTEIADKHDRFLETYRRTRVPRVIGKCTEVIAMRADGALFPAQLRVQEVHREAGGPLYVGFLQSIAREKELERSSQTTRAVTDASPVPIIVINLSGIVLRFSRAAETTFLYPERSVVGKNISMLMPTETAQKHNGFLLRYSKTKEKHVVGTTRLVVGRRNGGDLFHIELTLVEIDKEGSGKIIIGYARSVEAQRKLENEEQMGRAVTERSSIPIITITPNGTIMAFSKQACDDFKWSAEEVIGKNIKLLMSPQNAAGHDSYLASFVQRSKAKGAQSSYRTVQAMRKDGSFFPVELKVHLIASEDQFDSDVIVGYAKNMTDAFAVAMKFKVNEAVADVSHVPIIVVNHQGIIQRFSKAAESTWGTTEVEVLGKNIKTLMPPVIAQHHDGYLQTYLRTRVRHVIGTTRKSTAAGSDGREFPVQLQVHEIQAERGDPVWVGFVRDCSSDELAERSAQFREAISEFAPVPIIVLSHVGIIMDCNQACAQLFQYKLDELQGVNITVIQPPDVAVQHDKYLAAYQKTRKATIVGGTRRVTARKKSGAFIPVDITVLEVKMSKGVKQESVFIGYVLDASVSVRLEEATRAVDTVVNLSNVPVVATDSRGTVIKFSAAAELVFGWKQREVIGQNVKMLMPEEISSKHDRFLTMYRRTGVKRVIDTTTLQPAVAKDGKRVQVETCVREVKQQGKESVYVGYLRDVAEDKQVEREEAVISAVHDLCSSPMVLMDTQGCILQWNKAAATLFGYRAGEIVGVEQGVQMLQDPALARQHQGFIDAYLKTGIKKVIDTRRRVEGIAKNKRRIQLELLVREVRHGGKKAFLSCMHDLTEFLETEYTTRVNAAISSLAQHPLMVIDHIGTILRYSESAASCFQYTEDEVIGQNIKMLMPEEIARNHDEFLARYKRTGVKHVIDTTRAITARRKNGEEFPARVTVKEVKEDKTDSALYVGYVTDLCSEKSLQLAADVAQNVMMHASVPMVQLDEVGTVRFMNLAAAGTFGYDRSAIEGKNVKLLMPEQIARHHDGYLARYLRDGIKRVIDTTRNVTGQRADGSTFPVVISVREIRSGKEHWYNGYIRDTSTAAVLEKAVKENDAITAISPIPVIAITHMGRVLKFSPAAEALFGFTFEEMRGENVARIMPTEIGERHDGYLDAYRRTGKKTVLKGVPISQTGVTKEGERIPIALTVREVNKTGLEPVYVGVLHDSSFDSESDDSLTRAIADASPIPIIAMTVTGEIVRFSPAAEKVFGHDARELIGHQIETLMGEPLATAHPGYLKRYLTTGVKRVVGTTRRVVGMSKDGAEVALELTVREIKQADTHMFIAYARDLTQETEARMFMRMSSVVTELVDCGLICIESDGTITLFNAAAAKLFDFASNEVIGKNVRILMPEEVATQHDGYLQRYLQTGVKSVIDTSTTITGETKDGDSFDALLSVRELKEGSLDGKSSVFIGAIRKK
eukprot:Hpha_TRINITY_DN13607_c0_g1::TRINITY_DN13607_c0_g1_i2::g.122875::m.122875